MNEAREPTLRPATVDELAGIDALTKASTRDLFPNYYDAAQTEASIQYIAAAERVAEQMEGVWCEEMGRRS